MAPSSLASSEASSCLSEYDDIVVRATAVAIDKDRNSQFAVRWAVEKLLKKNDSVILVHVKTQSVLQRAENTKGPILTPESEMQHFFLPYRGFCGRKGVRTREIVLHDIDICNALVDFIHENSISNLVLGASSRSALTRAFRNADVPTSLSKVAPGFCSLHVVSKGKAQNVRPASQPCTPTSSKRQSIPRSSIDSTRSEDNFRQMSMRSTSSWTPSRISFDRNSDSVQLIPRERFNGSNAPSPQHSVMSRRSSPHHPSYSPNRRVRLEGNLPNQDYVDTSDFSGPPSFMSTDISPENFNTSRTSNVSKHSDAPQSSRDVESEMRRLRLELKKTMDMYSSASKEATNAREKAKEIDRWKTEEALKLRAAKEAQEAALALAEVEKLKTKAAMEAATMAQRIADLEVQKRKTAEMKVLYEAVEKKKAMDALARSEIRYRKYNIEDIESATDFFAKSLKIGEGGYGPVYKAFLDHTAVAIKVLRPDISQGKKQFEREVEVLSYIRHPNMVLLLGACPEYGCLVYEYMENGSLEDRIFRRNNTSSMTWQTRFKISAEIATSLLFLHQTKPEPLVHRDLKPANILLDRNYVSKISDVGLCRLVPPSVADSVTQYHLTSAAGTFCYIDPEYQQTGMLGVKSDVYSFGILLLQVITAKPAMGLTHYVERAIAKGTLEDVLDPTVPDWPLKEVLCFAKLALKCCELRRKDRPDLGTEILPELKRLSNFGLDDGIESGSPHSNITSFENMNYHRRTPFSEGPGSTSSCYKLTETTFEKNILTESENISLSKEGEGESSTDNLGNELPIKFSEEC